MSQVVGQFARQGQPAALPARHATTTAVCHAYVSRHVTDADQLKVAAGKEESVAGPQARNERLLDAAKACALEISHLEAAVGGDGTDRKAMHAYDARCARHVSTMFKHQLPVLRISRQGAPSGHQETKRCIESLPWQGCVWPCRGNLRIGFVGVETACHRECGQVLGENIQASLAWMAGLQMTLAQRIAGGGNVGQFEQMRRYAQDARRRTGLMPAAPGPLQQTGDALGAAYLDHLLDTGEIHAKIEAGRRHHTSQPAFAQGFFGREAQPGIDRAMMQGECVRIFGPHGG